MDCLLLPITKIGLNMGLCKLGLRYEHFFIHTNIALQLLFKYLVKISALFKSKTIPAASWPD